VVAQTTPAAAAGPCGPPVVNAIACENALPDSAAIGVDNGLLHALKDGVSGGDGVYVYGSAAAFPSNTFQSTNYWVDVVYASP
jgi:hypothetical protein